jgi:hypothetical protein
MVRRFVIAFIVTVAALLAYRAYQDQRPAPPMKKSEALAVQVVPT